MQTLKLTSCVDPYPPTRRRRPGRRPVALPPPGGVAAQRSPQDQNSGTRVTGSTTVTGSTPRLRQTPRAVAARRRWRPTTSR
eukprot:349677-Chlamydomonas_euryale.AAC.5